MGLLDRKFLPPTLWNAEEEIIEIPPALADVFKVRITSEKLADIAAAWAPESSPTGGLTVAEADQHFAQAFDSSVARTQLMILDPRDELDGVSDAVIAALSGDSVTITDAPVGAAAATLGLLCTIAELRSHGVLPRQPIEVQIVAGELSGRAREHAEWMLAAAKPRLAEQAIFIEYQLCEWDALDDVSNTKLIQASLRVCSEGARCLLVIANFSHFLHRQGKRKAAEPQLEELIRHLSQIGGIAVWIEPLMNQAIGPGGVFAWLNQTIGSAWRRIAHIPASNDGRAASPHAESQARYRRVLDAAKLPHVRLAVLRFVLGDRS